MALEYDIYQKEMQSLQQQYISTFKDLLGCEMGTILLLVDSTRELVFCVNKKWFRVPVSACVGTWRTMQLFEIPSVFFSIDNFFAYVRTHIAFGQKAIAL